MLNPLLDISEHLAREYVEGAAGRVEPQNANPFRTFLQP